MATVREKFCCIIISFSNERLKTSKELYISGKYSHNRDIVDTLHFIFGFSVNCLFPFKTVMSIAQSKLEGMTINELSIS